MTKRLNIGNEDTVQEIDTNADGKADVRVITDVAPQEGITDVPGDAPTFGPFALGEGSTPDPGLHPFARTWRDRMADAEPFSGFPDAPSEAAPGAPSA